VPGKLGEYAALQLARHGVELVLSTKLAAAQPGAVTLSDGTRIETETLVWTAGVVPNPLVQELGLPLDDRGHIVVDKWLRVAERPNVWALGDCAAVPNEATPERLDPPTCQHALRQARRLAKSLKGKERPYRYRSLGEGAALGRDKGIAAVFGFRVRGFLGGFITRWYHLHQVPIFSRRLRVLTDGTLSAFFRRDIAELGAIEIRQPLR
jgi:NADH:quinone reductase (non-electrogenic)